VHQQHREETIVSTPSEETVPDRPARTPLTSRLRDASIRTKMNELAAVSTTLRERIAGFTI